MNVDKIQEQLLEDIDDAGRDLPLASWKELLELLIPDLQTRLEAAKEDLGE